MKLHGTWRTSLRCQSRLKPKNHLQNFEGVGRDEVGKVVVIVDVVVIFVIVVVDEVMKK